jgi:hypothetical protein
MQQIKANKKLSVIEKYSSNSNILLESVSKLSTHFNKSGIARILNDSKIRGYKGYSIFQVLVCLRFIDLKNIRQFIHSDFASYCNASKDVFYDFMKNPNVKWRKILMSLTTTFTKIVDKNQRDQDLGSPKCFILDDTIIPKKGKSIEQIGKVHDHTSGGFTLGFKALTLGLWDGKVMIPIDFSLHNEPGKNGKRGMKVNDLKAQFNKERLAESSGKQRYLELGKSKVEVAIEMLKRAVKKLKDTQYLLVDTWFTCDELIKESRKIGIHVIGLMKTYRKVEINGITYMANKVGDLFQKKSHYNKDLKCNYIQFEITYKGLSMKAFWVKPRGQANWKMLICTEKSLKFKEAMKLYQIRWSIEVFFKECKQNLRLTKCQSVDFDSQIAHITLCYMTYTVLALKKRFDDYETMGEVFRDLRSELIQNLLLTQLIKLLTDFFDSFLAELNVDYELYISKIIENQNLLKEMVNENYKFLMPSYQDVA